MIFFKKIATALSTSVEKVTNGGFGADTAGWTGVDCTLASVAGGQTGNCLQITRTGGDIQYAKQVFAVTPGQKHLVSLYVKEGTAAGARFRAGFGLDPDVDRDLFTGLSTGAWVLYKGILIPKSEQITLYLAKVGNTAGTMLFDTVSVYPIWVVRAKDFHFQTVPVGAFDRTVKIFMSLNDYDFIDSGITITNNHAVYSGLISSLYPDVSGGTQGSVDILIGGRD